MSRPQRLIKDGQRQVLNGARRVGVADEPCCCTFVCFPAEDEFTPTDEELQALYPDVWMTVVGVLVCACFKINPGFEWIVYVEHGFDGHQYLLVPDTLHRSGTAHDLHYTYNSVNNPSIPSVGDGEITSTRYTGDAEDECTATAFPTVTDIYIVECGLTLRCSTETAPEWNWDFDSLLLGVDGGDIFNTATLPGGSWPGGIGEITTVPNFIEMGDCTAGDHPGGDGSLRFDAVPPGWGPP